MARGEAVTKETKERILKMKAEGLKRSVIKERLGVSDWVITNAIKDSQKNTYKGTFNWNREILILYTTTSSPQRAMKNFSHQLATLTGYSARYIREYFSPDANNWEIEELKKPITNKED